MKKLFVGLAALMLVGAIGVWVISSRKGEVALEDVLPQGAVFYVRLSDVEANIEKLTATQLWQNLRQVNYGLLWDKGQDQAQKAAMRSIQQTISNPATQAVLERFFGKEWAVAIYPVSVDLASVSEATTETLVRLAEEMSSSIFLATRVDSDIQLAESLSGFFNSYGPGFSMETTSYEDHAIHLVTLPGVNMKLGFVRMKDILVIGMGDKSVRLSVDVYQGRQKALKADPHFQKVAEEIGEAAGLFGYLNIGRFLAPLREQMRHFIGRLEQEIQKEGGEDTKGAGAKLVETKRQWEEVFNRMAGFELLAFSGRMDDIASFKFDLFLDKAGLDPQIAAHYTCPPSENKTLRFVPQDVLGYQWGNCFDFSYSWKQLKEEVARIQAQPDMPPGGLRDIGDVMGLSLEEEILPAFGDEVGGYLKGIQTSAAFPMPHILFFVKIKDQEKAQRLFAALEERSPLILQEEEYKGIKIKYVVSPLGDEVQPGYCVLEGYGLIALQRQTLKASIDAYYDPSLSLAGAPAFKEVDFGLSGPNRAVLFAQVGEIALKLEGVVEWGKTWMASQDTRRQAFQSGSERRLADVEKEIAVKKEETAAAQNRIAALEEGIWDQQSRGVDVSASQKEEEQLRENIKTLEGEIVLADEQKKELEKIIQGYEGRLSEEDKRDVLLDGVVHPFLKSLAFIKTVGARTTLQEGAVESILFLKVE